MLNQAEPGKAHAMLRTSIPVPILMYHGISSQASPGLRKYTVAPQLFAGHMAYLAEQYYTPITVTQFVRVLTGPKLGLPERPVILTFDDGFADFYTEVLPILQHYNFAATLYITTAFVGAKHWLKYEDGLTQPMLNWNQITAISAAGIECGAHSHRHPQLDRLPEAAARDEIVHCKATLEEHLGQEVSSFSYPFGYYTPAVRQWVREAGYSSACSVKNAISSTADDPFSLARLMVMADTSVDNFATMLNDHSLWVTDPRKGVRILAMQLLRYGAVQFARVFPSVATD